MVKSGIYISVRNTRRNRQQAADGRASLEMSKDIINDFAIKIKEKCKNLKTKGI